METKVEIMIDEEFFRLISTDKKSAEGMFTELYNRYSKRVYANFRRFLGDRFGTEDAVQETFYKIPSLVVMDNNY